MAGDRGDAGHAGVGHPLTSCCTMDALMERAEAVEERIAEQLRPMLDQQLSVVFYDLTTVRIHGDAQLPDDVRAFGMNKGDRRHCSSVRAWRGPIRRGIAADGHGACRQCRRDQDLERHAEQGAGALSGRAVILVADRGLLSLDNIAELSTLAEASERKLEFIRRSRRAMPNSAARWRRWISPQGWPRAVSPSSAWWSPTIRFARPSSRRDAENASRLEVFAEELVAKLDAQDEGKE